MIKKFMKKWYKQEIVKTLEPNPLWPPAQPQFITTSKFGDGEEIQGFHTPDQTDVSNLQFQNGRGIFIALMPNTLQLNNTLRNDEGNIYIKLIADEVKAPAHSPAQIVKWVYEVTSRSDAENEARDTP